MTGGTGGGASKKARFGVSGNQGGSESEKCLLIKDLGCGKVVGIMGICIVNARDSEPHKLPMLTFEWIQMDNMCCSHFEYG